MTMGRVPITGVTVWMTDDDPAALDVARANLAGIGRKGANVRIAAGPWFAALPDDVQLDLAVANPPYVAEGSPLLDDSVREWEPHHALFAGADGLAALRELIATAPRHVRPGGWLVLEIGADQGEAVGALLQDAGYDDIEIRRDLAGRDRVAIGRVPPSGRDQTQGGMRGDAL